MRDMIMNLHDDENGNYEGHHPADDANWVLCALRNIAEIVKTKAPRYTLTYDVGPSMEDEQLFVLVGMNLTECDLEGVLDEFEAVFS